MQRSSAMPVRLSILTDRDDRTFVGSELNGLAKKTHRRPFPQHLQASDEFLMAPVKVSILYWLLEAAKMHKQGLIINGGKPQAGRLAR